MANEINPISSVTDCVMRMLDGYNSGISKDAFYSNNIVDSTDVTEDDMRSVNLDVIHFCKENGCYAALPPFEEGSYIDRAERRYTHWKVLGVYDDYFRIEFNHYPILYVDGDYSEKIAQGKSAKLVHPCWYRSCRVVVDVKLLTTEDHVAMLKYHPDFEGENAKLLSDTSALTRLSDVLKTQYHVGGVLVDYEDYHSHDFKKILKKGKYYTDDDKMIDSRVVRKVVSDSLELSVARGLNSILFCSLGPIIEMFVYINYMLSQKSTGSSTLRHITSVYLPNAEFSDTRKERHFGRIKIVSEKKPRTVTAENIQRVYTTLSWQRRSHLRHLKSGKVVPVKSAICNRRNFESDASAPQVVYRV